MPMATTQLAASPSVGLRKTFDLLATTKNDVANTVLLTALDSPFLEVQRGGLEALLKRRCHQGQTEILRRLPANADAWRPIIDQRRGALAHALRDGLLGGDSELCQSACQAILWFREYDLAAALVTAAEDETNPQAPLAAQTLLALADLLYEELAAGAPSAGRRDPQVVRRNFTHTIEGSAQRFARHKRLETLRAFLSLAGRENATLKRIFQDPLHTAFVPMMDILLHDQRGGIVRLLLSFLDDPHAPSAAISALGRRDDLKFVTHLMRKIGFAPSVNAAQNLRRIDTIGWLKTDPRRVDSLDDAAQHSLIQVVLATSIKRDDAFAIVEHVLRFGKRAGRRAAATALARFNGADANLAAQRALTDDCPEVQAAIIKQIRQRGIPGALNRVIEFLDNPSPVVRDAARQSLVEFDFERYLAAYDLLDDEIRRSTGELVLKVNPGATEALRKELAARTRTRRMRALGVAMAMGAVPELRETIISMLTDDDHLVRTEAAVALGHAPHVATRAALREMLADRNIPVREAALRSLERLDSLDGPSRAL